MEINDHHGSGQTGGGTGKKLLPMDYDSFSNLRLRNVNRQDLVRLLDILRFGAVSRTME